MTSAARVLLRIAMSDRASLHTDFALVRFVHDISVISALMHDVSTTIPSSSGCVFLAECLVAPAEALHSVVEAAADEFKVAGLLDEVRTHQCTPCYPLHLVCSWLLQSSDHCTLYRRTAYRCSLAHGHDALCVNSYQPCLAIIKTLVGGELQDLSACSVFSDAFITAHLQGPRRAGGTAAIKALLDAGGGTDEWTGIRCVEGLEQEQFVFHNTAVRPDAGCSTICHRQLAMAQPSLHCLCHIMRTVHHSPARTATLACRGDRAEGRSWSRKLADPILLMRSMTDWSSLVPQPANQKALLASRVFVRHYPHQGEQLVNTLQSSWRHAQLPC